MSVKSFMVQAPGRVKIVGTNSAAYFRRSINDEEEKVL
jgi:hypothetical protein